MSIWSLHDGTNWRATLVTKPSDARLCDALSFIVHCCMKPSGIHSIDASGYIRPYALNNIDIRALCWPQEDINRRIGMKPLTYPGLKTTISANAWLSMCGSLWGPRMWSIYRKISKISGTKSQNLNVSCLVLQVSLCNLLKSGVKSTMKM